MCLNTYQLSWQVGLQILTVRSNPSQKTRTRRLRPLMFVSQSIRGKAVPAPALSALPGQILLPVSSSSVRYVLYLIQRAYPHAVSDVGNRPYQIVSQCVSVLSGPCRNTLYVYRVERVSDTRLDLFSPAYFFFRLPTLTLSLALTLSFADIECECGRAVFFWHGTWAISDIDIVARYRVRHITDTMRCLGDFGTVSGYIYGPYRVNTRIETNMRHACHDKLEYMGPGNMNK